MREKRKQELLHSFPNVSNEFMNQMQGKSAANFCVFLTYGAELYVRCYHRYSKSGSLIERQRYVFAKDGAVRYGFDSRSGWRIIKNFREPLFCSKLYGYNFDNRYNVINFEAIFKSDMKYCPIDSSERLPISYLKLYCRHPNIEYLVKSGYAHLIETVRQGCWGGLETLKVSGDINWKSNNLLKMLRLNRTEFKMLQGDEQYYLEYINCRREFPKYKPEELIIVAKVYGNNFGLMQQDSAVTGLPVKRIARYLNDNNIRHYDYDDYIQQCRELHYNLHDTAINMPHNFYEVHERLSAIIKYEENEKTRREFNKRIAGRTKFEFEFKNLTFVQPKDICEIVNEGRVLMHCVGGYVQRHADGKTNIFFIRHKSEPDVPYFTIEVSNDYKIIQCHGYRNERFKDKPEEIVEFEKQYTEYLEGLKNAEIRNSNQRTA